MQWRIHKKASSPVFHLYYPVDGNFELNSSSHHAHCGDKEGEELFQSRSASPHETNTFAPQRATWDDFARADAWPGFVRGAELIDAVHGYNIPIAGAVEALKARGHELLPLCWCSAPPSSYVERAAYERVAGAILDDLAAQAPVDGIYLDLHGAMVAEHHEDGEGELLRRIRVLVGDRVPIVTSLDYHTNMTAEMVRHASAMVGYRTYPHIDMAATGGRAALFARPPLAASAGRSTRPIARSTF